MLKNKSILLISPQKWGDMLLSKHHYALQLSKRGNRVFFMNTPSKNSSIFGKITPIDKYDNLWIMDYRLFFPLRLKNISLMLFNFLMKIQIFMLVKKNRLSFDFIWSFESSMFFNYDWFNGDKVVFFPVDEPKTNDLHLNKNFNYIFSVTKEILKKYNAKKTSKMLVNHSISSDFTKGKNIKSQPKSKNTNVKACYIGNLLRFDIDKQIFKKIIRDNPSVEFHLIGSYKKNQSNIGFSEQNIDFIKFLESSENVFLYGVIKSNLIFKFISDMDLFLICYDIKKDQSKGTNYHKIMEYLSTGKVVVSNNVSAYSERENLIEMTKSRENNKELPELFSKIVNKIEHYNSIKKQCERIDYALQNTYEKNISRIEQFIYHNE